MKNDAKKALDAVQGLENLSTDEAQKISGGFGGFLVTNDPFTPVPITAFGVKPIVPTYSFNGWWF